jgi:hypothetical protein
MAISTCRISAGPGGALPTHGMAPIHNQFHERHSLPSPRGPHHHSSLPQHQQEKDTGSRTGWQGWKSRLNRGGHHQVSLGALRVQSINCVRNSSQNYCNDDKKRSDTTRLTEGAMRPGQTQNHHNLFNIARDLVI